MTALAAAAGRVPTRAVTLLVGLLAATPVLLAAIRLFAADWTPVGDDAVIALRAYDVLTGDPPLIGQHSASSEALAGDTYGLGPLLYWLLALPSRFGGAGALTVVVCLVNVAAVVGAVALARRRGGTVLMLLTAAAVVVMSGSLVSKVFADVWNPAVAVLPFMLLAFTAWSIACGEYALVPLAVLLASFVAQCHLTYVLPSSGLLAVAALGLWMARRDVDRAALRRSALIGLVVGAVCWAAPVVQQATDRPGNLAQIARAAVADTPKTGLRTGGDAIVRTAGIPGWWMESADHPNERFADLAGRPGAVRIATAALAILALFAMIVVALQRDRRDVAAAGACSLVLVAGVASVATSTPTVGVSAITLGYTMWWASVAGMFMWLTLVWGGAQLVGERRRTNDTSLTVAPLAGRTDIAPRPGSQPIVNPRNSQSPIAPARARRQVALAVAASAVAVVALVRAGVGTDPLEPTYEPMRAIAERVEDAVPAGDTLLVEAAAREAGFYPQFDYEMGAIYALRRHGAKPVVRDVRALGDRYAPGEEAVDARLLVGVDGREAPRGAREIARVEVDGSPPRTVVVWLAPPR